MVCLVGACIQQGLLWLTIVVLRSLRRRQDVSLYHALDEIQTIALFIITKRLIVIRLETVGVWCWYLRWWLWRWKTDASWRQVLQKMCFSGLTSSFILIVLIRQVRTRLGIVRCAIRWGYVIWSGRVCALDTKCVILSTEATYVIWWWSPLTSSLVWF